MVKLFFIIVASVLIKLVSANPLMQSIQSYPVNYQQIYRQPQSEPILLQPSNIVPYPQQLLIQNPLPAYQPLQVPSLRDQITQILWEKLLSSPTLRNILDPNNVYNQNVQDILPNYQNPCNAGVVNNYIIVPPEYVKLNETVHGKRDTQVSSNLKGSITELNPTTSKTKKILNSNGDRKNVKSNSPKRRKAKQSSENKTNKNPGNIKCYTPADVLDDRSKVRNNGNENIINKPNKKKSNVQKAINTATPINKSDEIEEKHRKKPSKSTNNKIKKVSSKTEPKNCKKEVLENNISTRVTTQGKSKPKKANTNECCCNKQNVLPGEHIARAEPQNKQMCYDDVNDIFNLKQDCIDLENRRTRNSKNNVAAIEPYKMYQDLPDDMSRIFAKYINDLYLHTQVSNTNSFGGNNMFPYDFSQIYQVPRAPNGDMKANSNKGRTRQGGSTRRKKKSKTKNSGTKKKEEKAVTNDDGNIEASKTNIGVEPGLILKTTELTIEVPPPFSLEVNDSMPAEKIRLPEEEHINIEKAKHENEIIYINPKSVENYTAEAYETQIPETIEVSNITEGFERVEYENLKHYETPSNFNDIPELLPEDEVFSIFDNRLLEDYYPDFTKDNFAYLESEEEIDLRNSRDRYFYTTDKNVGLKGRLPAQSFTSNEKIICDDDTWNNVVEHNEKHWVRENESEEIVFRTPPRLDFPDFTTRKTAVNRDKHDSNEVYYEHKDNDEFDRFNLDNVAERSDHSVKTAERYENPNDRGSVVETVYAGSKVVKYGTGRNSKTPLKTASDRDIKKDGDKIIVIAKTVGSDDIW